MATLSELSAQVATLQSTVDAMDIGSLPGSSGINVSFTLISGYLVFFMQVGFAMLCAGAVRAKNAKNIILLNLLDACFGSWAWYLTGFAFAFGDPIANDDGTYNFAKSQAFIGNRYFAQNRLARTSYVTWFFQFTFAATAATIVSGAVAERCRFECYMMYELMLVMFVYPVIAHWVWSPFGWLSATRTPETIKTSWLLFAGSGVYDFAGDGPVHMVGGFASLAGAWILGPRIGRFDADGKPVAMPGHSASLNLLGVFFLWFGWYGFNPGSTNAVVAAGDETYSKVSAVSAVNTTIGAASGAIATLFTAMIHQYIHDRVVVWDLIVCGNGALAGLVAITGPCPYVNVWSAFPIGAIGGILMFFGSKLNLNVLHIDDPLDAIAVHAYAGAWGMISCAAFAAPRPVTDFLGANPYDGGQRPYGFINGGNGRLLGAHLVYIIVIAVWTLGFMTPFFYVVKRVGLMRVPPEWEVQGIDVSIHGGSAYPHDVTAVPDPEPAAKHYSNPAAEGDVEARIQAALAEFAAAHGLDANGTAKETTQDAESN